MRISIITVTYNAGDNVKKTLDSIIAQRYRSYEVVLVDGGSTDKTLEIVKSYKNMIESLFVVSEPDKGIYDAMNKGIGLAKGEYVYFLNAGDILYDNGVFASVAGALDGKSVVYGNAITMDEKGKEVPYRTGEFSKYRLAHTNICHQTIFYPKKALGDRRYDLKYKLFADWVLNMSLWKSVGYKYVDKNVVLYENGGVSATQEDKIFASEQKDLILKYLGIDALVYLGLRKILRWK